MTYHWACTCGESGTDTSTAKTDKSHDDAKHLDPERAACRGVVLTGQQPDSLARMVASVRAAG
jgi:hypothetical protein